MSKLKPQKRSGIILTALPAVLTSTVVILAVFAVKGIFPFGSDSVAYMDMWQMNVPIYYHIYDVIRGDKSLFYDMYSALGMNMSESVAICSLLSPFNFFFYFVPRNEIVNFMAIFTLIKIDFAVFFMSVFLRYKFKNVHNFWRTMASFAYGCCGLNMIFCTNSQWLDISALFPLLMLALDYSLTNRKVIPYALMMGIFFITNPYLAAITLLFVFFAGSVKVIFYTKKGERTWTVLNFGIGTVCGIAFSAFLSIPFIRQMSKTSRSPSDIIATYKAVLLADSEYTSGNAQQKFWMLWGTALACAIIIYGIILNWKKVKKNILSLICIAFVVLQVFFENINLLWHGGSYAMFPLRFGFLISFILWTVAMSYVESIPQMNTICTVKQSLGSGSFFGRISRGFWAVVCIAVIPFIARFIANSFLDSAFDDRISFAMTLFWVFAAIYFAFINKNTKNILRLGACAMLTAEVAAGAYLFIGKPYIDPFFGQTQDMEFAKDVADVGDAFEMSDSVLSRVKNADGQMLSNYPFIMKKSAVSNWTHSVDTEIQGAYRNLGYSTVYTRILDTGGTVFTDALINIEDVITSQTLSDKAYTYVDSYEDFNHYKTNYAFGFGSVMSSSVIDIIQGNTFTMQNEMFKAMGGETNLFRQIQTGATIDTTVITSKVTEGNNVTYSINVTGTQELYLAGMAAITMNVNGEDVMVPNSLDMTNRSYPVLWNNAIFDLGTFTDETVTLTIQYINAVDESYMNLALMDYSLLDSLMQSDSMNQVSVIEEGTNGFELEAQGSAENDFLLLPVSYDDGLVCKVNGKEVKVEKIFGCFAGVRINEGENTVSVNFVPDGMKEGICIGIAAAVLLLVYNFVFLRRRKPHIADYVDAVVIWEFAKLWVIAVILIYVIPILYNYLK